MIMLMTIDFIVMIITTMIVIIMIREMKMITKRMMINITNSTKNNRQITILIVLLINIIHK